MNINLKVAAGKEEIIENDLGDYSKNQESARASKHEKCGFQNVRPVRQI